MKGPGRQKRPKKGGRREKMEGGREKVGKVPDEEGGRKPNLETHKERGNKGANLGMTRIKKGQCETNDEVGCPFRGIS